MTSMTLEEEVRVLVQLCTTADADVISEQVASICVRHMIPDAGIVVIAQLAAYLAGISRLGDRDRLERVLQSVFTKQVAREIDHEG